MAAAGLEHRVQIRVQDYRLLTDGPYDKIASVGMYEHVGQAELAHYARLVASLLRPGGLFLNHGITRLDVEALRDHYPLTLRRWVANLTAHRDEALCRGQP